MTRQRLLVYGAALVALALGAWLGATLAGRTEPVPTINGTVFPNARALPDFRLVDHEGNPFSPEQLKGRWTLLYFGYTYCPDVCPTTLYELSRADALLEGEGAARGIAYALVSVDPDRDTPERLAQYVPHFSDKLLGVSGPTQALTALTQPLGIVYVKVEGADPDNYLVDHSSAVIVINPEGKFQAIMSAPHEAEDMAADMLALKAYYGR